MFITQLEVMDPSLVVYAEGFFSGGLKLYILKKIKDTLYGEKNITLISNLAQVKRKNSIMELAINHSVVRSAPAIWKIKGLSAGRFAIHQRETLNIDNVRSFHTKVNASNRIGPHNEDVISVLVGSLLGDCYGSRRTVEGTRFCFRQSIVHKEYLFWLYDFFHTRGYCSNLKPRKYTRILKVQNNKEHFGYEFNTFTFRSFNWIHDMFYRKGKKVIRPELENYLTPLALAVWVMDDGGFAKPGVRISTYNFSLDETKFLVSLLKKLYGLECTTQIKKNGVQSAIYIKKESVPKLIKIVLPYMHDSMHHKLGINI